MSRTCNGARAAAYGVRASFGQQSGRGERVERPRHLRPRESCGSSRTSYIAGGLGPVQPGEQRAEAFPAKDQRGVGIEPDLKLVLRALNDGRVRRKLRALHRRMRLGSGSGCGHRASFWAAGVR